MKLHAGHSSISSTFFVTHTAVILTAVNVFCHPYLQLSHKRAENEEENSYAVPQDVLTLHVQRYSPGLSEQNYNQFCPKLIS